MSDVDVSAFLAFGVLVKLEFSFMILLLLCLDFKISHRAIPYFHHSGFLIFVFCVQIGISSIRNCTCTSPLSFIIHQPNGLSTLFTSIGLLGSGFYTSTNNDIKLCSFA